MIFITTVGFHVDRIFTLLLSDAYCKYDYTVSLSPNICEIGIQYF